MGTTSTLSDIIGQVLYRHRRAKPLRRKKHRDTVTTLWWAADPDIVDDVERVFHLMTGDPLSDDGRMKVAEWRKVVELIKLNPVLQKRLRRGDGDRLFSR